MPVERGGAATATTAACTITDAGRRRAVATAAPGMIGVTRTLGELVREFADTGSENALASGRLGLVVTPHYGTRVWFNGRTRASQA